MNPLAIIATIQTVIQVAQTAIQAGKDAAPFIVALKNTITGKKPEQITQEDLDELEARIDALSEEFQQPLPPED